MGRLVSYSCDKCGRVVNIPLDVHAHHHLRGIGWAISMKRTLCENCRVREAPRNGRSTKAATAIAREALTHLEGVLDPEQLAVLDKLVNRGKHYVERRKAKRAAAALAVTVVEAPAPAPPATPKPPSYASVSRHEIGAALARLTNIQLSTFCEVIRKQRGAPNDVGLPNNGRDTPHDALVAHARRESKTTDRAKPGCSAHYLHVIHGVRFA